MHILPFTLIIAALVVAVLKPRMVNNLILWRIHPDARPSAEKLVPVALAATFIFSLFAFQFSVSLRRQATLTPVDPVQEVFRAVAGVVFLLYGGFACLRPMRFVGTLSPRLRRSASGFDERSINRVEITSRAVGILLILVSAFLLSRFIA